MDNPEERSQPSPCVQKTTNDDSKRDIKRNNKVPPKVPIKKNFAFQVAYDLLILILPFITSPYVSRVIGADGLGTFSYANAVAYYFVMFAALGIQNYGRRLIAKNMDDRAALNAQFSSLCTVHISVSLICTIAYIGYLFVLPGEKLYAGIMFFYVISALFDISWFYFGIEKFKLTVVRNTIIRIVTVICVFALVRSEDDLWIYCFIMSFGNLLSQLVLWFPLKRYATFVKPSFSQMRVHLKPLAILFLPVVAISFYRCMDKIMIGLFSDITQLGYYENAEKIPNMAMTVIGSFGSVALSRMSYLTAKGEEKAIERYMRLSMEFVMCLAMALTFGVAGISVVFAPVFWGSEFSSAGPIIMGLSLTMPFLAFANVLRTQHLLPKERDREYTISLFAAAGVNLVSNLILIRPYGAIGAVVGTVFAEMTVCILQSLMVRKELPLWQYFRSFVFFIVLGAVMFFCVWNVGQLMGAEVLTLVVQVLVGVVLYGVGAIVYFVIRKNEVVLGMLKPVLAHINH